MHPDILRLHASIEQEHWWFVARRRIVRRLLQIAEPPTRDSRLLDLGCGTGGNLGDLCEDYRCLGVEIDPQAVEFAAAQYPACDFVCGSIYDPGTWGLESGVDVCLIMDVLEHLDDDRTAVRNAVDALRPGGHLLVTVPANPALWGRHDLHHEHRRRYTTESLASLLDQFEIEGELLTAFNAHLYAPIRLLRGLQNRLPSIATRSTTGDLKMPAALTNRLLGRIFAGEAARLEAALRGRRDGFRKGVSLLALYRRRGSR